MAHKCGYQKMIRHDQMDPPECDFCDGMDERANEAWNDEGRDYLKREYRTMPETLRLLLTAYADLAIGATDTMSVQDVKDELEDARQAFEAEFREIAEERY